MEVTQTEVTYDRWQHTFAPPTARSIARGDAYVDGEHVWVFRPDSMLGQGEGDGWLVLAAADGRVVAEATLPTEGQGAIHHRHPDGVHVLLDVGEGQDGSYQFLGHLDGTELVVRAYPWDNRIALGFAPGGTGFMTVDHDQEDVAFHAFPSGERTRTVGLSDLPQPEVGEETLVVVGWGGGYLDATRAVVIVEWEGDDEEMHHVFHVVDLESGAVLGQLDVPGEAENVELPGDGTWIQRDEDGRSSRWTFA
ncbi:hypothetical protein [Lentzea sp. NPDC055074]